MTAMLALGVSEETAWRPYQERCTVGGRWAAFERAVAAALTEELSDVAVMVPSGDEHWSIVMGDAGEMYLAPFTDREAWAKVRVTVTVEVLDGLL